MRPGPEIDCGDGGCVDGCYGGEKGGAPATTRPSPLRSLMVGAFGEVGVVSGDFLPSLKTVSPLLSFLRGNSVDHPG